MLAVADSAQRGLFDASWATWCRVVPFTSCSPSTVSGSSAAIGIGLSGVNPALRIRIALAFGFFEAAMPLVGLLIGRQLASSIGSHGHYVGAGLLIATGAYAI